MNHYLNLLSFNTTLESVTMLSAVFRNINVNLIKALSVAEALEKTRGIELALAIIDVRMNNMNGIELAIELNKGRTDNYVPVIFLTTSEYKESDVLKWNDLLVVDYIHEPVNKRVLTRKIKPFLDLFIQKKRRKSGVQGQIIASSNELSGNCQTFSTSDANFHRIFDQSPVGFLIIGLDLHIIKSNAAFCNFIGYSEDALIGKTMREFTHPEDTEIGKNEVKQLFEGKMGSCSFIKRYIRKDGRVIWGEISTGLVHDETNEPLYFMPVIQDITLRKHTEDALNVSRSLLTSCLEGQKDTILLSIDHDYRYLYFNEAHHNSMKYSYKQDVKLGMNILECITAEDDRKISKENYDRALKGESHSNVRRYGDIEFAWYESYFNPICNENGEIIGATALARNITERKEEEETIKKLKEDLEDRVKEQTFELIESNAAIQKIQKNTIKEIIQTEEKERSHFSKELHDGLGPLLSTLKLYLQWFQRPKRNISQEEIIREALEILEDTLKTVKEISNKLSPHILRDYGLTSAIQKFIAQIMKSSAIRISFQSNSIMRFEDEIEVSVYRAVIECINNTLKHAEAKNITILLTDCQKKLHLVYRDDGVGFDIPETLSRQTGLGLFDLQNRIENINGKITLFSRPGEGVEYQIDVYH